MNRIIYLYRKFNFGYSIEGLFNQLSNAVRKKNSFTVQQETAPESALTTINVWRNLQFARRQQADIYHITGDIHYIMLGLPPSSTVLTIHDCVSLKRFKSEGKLVRYAILWLLYYYLPMRRAKYITTVSEKSKQELAHYMGQSLANKVWVINNHYNPHFVPVPKRFNVEKPVILHIGTAAHKNLPRLIQALQGVNCTLVVVGHLDVTQKVLLEKSDIDYKQKERLTEEEILAEYQACDLVSFLSTYEGFGMPIVEAQAIGRAVLTSNILPMCDIVGEGGHIVDPYNVESIRDGLLKLINDDAYRCGLIEKGYINASNYSIEKITARYEALYTEILSTR